jgi:hypothetical protein
MSSIRFKRVPGQGFTGVMLCKPGGELLVHVSLEGGATLDPASPSIHEALRGLCIDQGINATAFLRTGFELQLVPQCIEEPLGDDAREVCIKNPLEFGYYTVPGSSLIDLPTGAFNARVLELLLEISDLGYADLAQCVFHAILKQLVPHAAVPMHEGEHVACHQILFNLSAVRILAGFDVDEHDDPYFEEILDSTTTEYAYILTRTRCVSFQLADEWAFLWALTCYPTPIGAAAKRLLESINANKDLAQPHGGHFNVLLGGVQ